MRQLRDLTPDEKSAYRIWQAKLADRTLSAQQHDQARREIDLLLWKGPNSQVLALKAEIAALEARLERLEFHAGLADGPLVHQFGADKDQILPPELSGHFPDAGQSGLKQSVTVDVSGGHIPVEDKKDPANPPAPETEVATPTAEPVTKETRGRKKLRFVPDKNATGGWMILDRELGADGEYLDAEPFRTRKDAKEITDELNAGRVPAFLKGRVEVTEGTVAGSSEEPYEAEEASVVTVTEETAAGEEIPPEGVCGLHVDANERVSDPDPEPADARTNQDLTDLGLGF